MYGFVDTQPTESAKQGLSLQTIFNQINLDEHLTDDDGSFMTLAVNGRNDFSYRINSIAVPGGDGEVEQDDPPIDSKTIIVEYKLKANSNELLREKFNQLNGLLKGSKVELKFTDEDALFYTTPRINSVPDERSNDLVGTIEFYCSDPHKYGPEQSVNFSSDTAVIENEGTAEAKPVIELTAKEPVTFAMVSNGDEYNLVGTPVDVEQEVVDTKTLLLEERGQTLDTWSSTGTDVDVGVVSGNFSYDGIGITVSDYGETAADRWYGPALIKEVQAIQDFEVDMFVDVRTVEPDQTFRIEFYLFDEAMNVLGKMGIKDNGIQTHFKKGIGRLGEELGGTTNYFIHSGNYEYNWDTFNGLVRLRRMGNQFEFYIARTSNRGNHIFTLTKTFNDKIGKYDGRLKYIQIHTGKHAGTAQAYTPRINSIRVTELNKATVDQTPYFAYAGDKIVFDHENRDVLLNGEAIAKQIGGDFFTLKKGFNTLATMPAGAFDGQVKFKPRYR